MLWYSDEDPLRNAVNPNEAWRTTTGLGGLTTAELIKELERRRPVCTAETCAHMGSDLCGECIWSVFIAMEDGEVKDNFKEADHGQDNV